MRLSLFLAVPIALFSAEPPPSPAINPDSYLNHIKILASEKLKGRGTGSKQLEEAAEYIAKQFKTIGLQPVSGSYFQRFPVTTQARLGGGNKLTFTAGGQKSVQVFDKEFIPMNFSAGGSVSG